MSLIRVGDTCVSNKLAGVVSTLVILSMLFGAVTSVNAHFETAEDAAAAYTKINKKIDTRYDGLNTRLEKWNLETKQAVLSLTQMIIENRIGEVQKRRASPSKATELGKLRRDFEGNYDKLRFINQKLEDLE